jgi:hypothetical protein
MTVIKVRAHDEGSTHVLKGGRPNESSSEEH